MAKEKTDFDIKLVKIVEQHPCLYNYQLPEYSKRDSVARAWEKVAQKMNESGNNISFKSFIIYLII